MSDGAWQKMPQNFIKNFVIRRADSNDQKISIQLLKRNNYILTVEKHSFHHYLQPKTIILSK